MATLHVRVKNLVNTLEEKKLQSLESKLIIEN